MLRCFDHRWVIGSAELSRPEHSLSPSSYRVSCEYTGNNAPELIDYPVIIKLYHHFASPKLANHIDPTDSANTPLLADSSSTPDARQLKHTHQHPHHTPAFDLIIAELSLLLEVACYGLLPFFASLSVHIFKPIYIVLSILAACGAGYGPAFQSLAVELYTRRGGTESGKLFGTISVIQATS